VRGTLRDSDLVQPAFEVMRPRRHALRFAGSPLGRSQRRGGPAEVHNSGESTLAQATILSAVRVH
jgi:hypothetical protein